MLPLLSQSMPTSPCILIPDDAHASSQSADRLSLRENRCLSASENGGDRNPVARADHRVRALSAVPTGIEFWDRQRQVRYLSARA